VNIELPDEVRDAICVVSVSGGKDSAAVMLSLLDRRDELLARNCELRFVFADTGWESALTYAHLDTMRTHLGIQIDVVGVEGGMRGRIAYRAGFPSRIMRWCTQELKLKPLRAYHEQLRADTGKDTISVVGVRGGESEARQKMPVFAYDNEWDGFVWRPIHAWTVTDVLLTHRKFGLPMNPLYQRGHDRVGCYPCIFENKDGIALIAKNDPDRIDEIAALEQQTRTLRAERNAERTEAKSGDVRYQHPQGYFFQSRDRKSGVLQDIHQVVEWSRTARGGKQMLLFDPVPLGGCMRWGLCETSPTDSNKDAK